MKKQFRIRATEGLLGDVIVTAHWDATVTVEREVPDPVDDYPAGTLLKIENEGNGESHAFKINRGGYGSAAWLLLFDDGSYGTFEFGDFKQVDADEKPEPAKPQITREQFIQTLRKTAEDNGLVRLDGLQLNTLIVFAADRLGLY